MARGRREKEPSWSPTPLSRLGHAMRDVRRGVSLNQLAEESGWAKSTLSNAEHGRRAPGLELIEYYERRFRADGLLFSLYATYVQQRASELRARRRNRSEAITSPPPEPTEGGGARIPGDAAHFLDEGPPDGTIFKPSESFTKWWVIRNAGSVPWRGRYLARVGPPGGAGLIQSPLRVPIPDTEPGEQVRIEIPLQAPKTEATSIAYFKMTDETGELYFPGTYAVGLGVGIIVRRTHRRR